MTFKPGDIATWTPAISRRGFYGQPGAYDPVDVIITKGPRADGRCNVKVLSKSLARMKHTTVSVRHLVLKTSQEFSHA